jgi:hypothetical protein
LIPGKAAYEGCKLRLINKAGCRVRRKPLTLALMRFRPLIENFRHVHGKHINAKLSLSTFLVFKKAQRLGRNRASDSRLLKSFLPSTCRIRAAIHGPTLGDNPAPGFT